jgi:hypothetical protein
MLVVALAQPHQELGHVLLGHAVRACDARAGKEAHVAAQISSV